MNDEWTMCIIFRATQDLSSRISDHEKHLELQVTPGTMNKKSIEEKDMPQRPNINWDKKTAKCESE